MRVMAFLAMTALAACNSQPAPVEANNDVVVNAPDPAAPPVIPAPAAPGATGTTPTPPFAETPGAHPTAPEPAPIPAKFRGTWAESKAACDPKHSTWLGISGRTVRSPTYVIFGDSFTFPRPNQFALKGKIEGTNKPAEAHYSINAAGDVLTDEAGGGAVRVRCG